MFARMIANRPRYHQQAFEVVEASTPKRVAGAIDRRVTALLARPEVAAAAVLLPNLTTLGDLAKALIGLQALPHWEVKFGSLLQPQVGELVTVAITREIPTAAGGMIPSEALVLGPFSEFPRTRQAPVPALEIYVGEPLELDPKTQAASTKANLAHMNIRLPTPDAFQRMWDLSVAGRSRSLGGVDDLRAKAKVAFVLPKALATALGVKT